ncbi:DinB family protein [Longispora albida]|uniref:DinB family protein n=1 Tax=Longispora albida TaxID=203523 RepID=UPI000476C2B9|nr:DinB family protein [Longispora albida]
MIDDELRAWETQLVPEVLPVLTSILNGARAAVIAKVTGLTAEQGRTSGVPSGTSPHGLLRHLADAEKYWFEVAFLGLDEPVDFSASLVPEGATEASLLAGYRAAIRRSNEIIAGAGDPLARGTGDREQSLQWIIAHMIQETARHAGHADILREQLDGTTGHRVPRTS